MSSVFAIGIEYLRWSGQEIVCSVERGLSCYEFQHEYMKENRIADLLRDY